VSEFDPESGATIPDSATAPFPNPCETAHDYATEARNHVVAQYRDSPRLMATVDALVANHRAMEEQMVTIPLMDDPAIAGGVNLDVTGELVGQGRVLSDGTVSSDLFFRTLIAARILRNKSIGSGPEFVTYLETVVFGGAFRFYDLGGMSVGIEVAGEPNSNEKALINDGPSPRAMAVGIGKLWYTDAGFFGFQGDPRPGLDGFGLESDLSLGGRMGMLF
jgi:hypothetical protein